MKNAILKFLVSRLGGVLTPVIALGVGWLAAKVAAFDANLAGQLDQTAITAFVVAAILAGVNYLTNSVQTDGVKRIQVLVNADPDGVPGPVTYTEVRRAVLANGNSSSETK